MIKQVIVMRKDLNMRKGKMAVQAAHASLGVFFKSLELGTEINVFHFSAPWSLTHDWQKNGTKKICVGVNSEQELIETYNKAKELDILAYLVLDNGLTEFHGIKTPTCCAIGPGLSTKIDIITEHLSLL